MRISSIIQTCVSLFLLSATAVSDPLEPTAIAFGDLRGYFEPCGCDPKTDLGGVARLSGLIARERRAHSDLLVLGLGNNFDLLSSDNAKDDGILNAMREIRPDAVLFNLTELKYLERSPRHLGLSKIPYVLSNSRSKTSAIMASVKTKSAEIFGFTSEPSHLGAGEFVSDKRFTLPTALPRILLFSGPIEALNILRDSRLFALIVASNSHTVENKDGPLGKVAEDSLKVAQGPSDVFMTPFGGQGVLRFGRAFGAEAKGLGALLGNEKCKSDLFSKCETMPSVLAASRVSWLSQEYSDASTINRVTAKYNQARAAEFAKLRKERLKNLKNSPYVGANTCVSCHPSSHGAWSQTKHANALAVLENVGKDRDPDCVSCHVVGFNTGIGFVDGKSTPHLANVQCENCHGPRKSHVENPTIKGEPANLEACRSCHQGQHSPDFDPPTYWQKILHGKG